MNGILRKYGWYKSSHLSVVQVSDKIRESVPFYEKAMQILAKGDVVANKIVYKNTSYNCDDSSSVLVHEDLKKSKFSFGILKKIIIKQELQCEILRKATTFSVKMLTLEATPSATQFFKRSYRIIRNPGL